jgi:hypothetical protein
VRLVVHESGFGIAINPDIQQLPSALCHERYMAFVKEVTRHVAETGMGVMCMIKHQSSSVTQTRAYLESKVRRHRGPAALHHPETVAVASQSAGTWLSCTVLKALVLIPTREYLEVY